MAQPLPFRFRSAALDPICPSSVSGDLRRPGRPPVQGRGGVAGVQDLRGDEGEPLRLQRLLRLPAAAAVVQEPSNQLREFGFCSSNKNVAAAEKQQQQQSAERRRKDNLKTESDRFIFPESKRRF